MSRCRKSCGSHRSRTWSWWSTMAPPTKPGHPAGAGTVQRARPTHLIRSISQGMGTALRKDFQAESDDICIVQDADLEYDPQEFPLVISPIVDNKAHVVFGIRFQGGVPIGLSTSGIAWAMHSCHCLATCSPIRISQTWRPATRPSDKKIIQSIQIRENRLGFEPEVIAKVA